MDVNYLVVGQGLAGTLVSHHLLKEGKKIFVFDSFQENSSSRIAAGLFNPVTGQRVVKTWLADTIFPFLDTYYTELEQFLSSHFLHRRPIFRPFESLAEQNAWFGQSADESYRAFIDIPSDIAPIQSHYNAPFGGLYSKQSGFVDVKTLLLAFEKHLTSLGALSKEVFDLQKLTHTENGVEYEHIKADAILFCEGSKGMQNTLFNYLPLNGTKGQIVEVAISNYELETIVNKGVFVLPYGKTQRIGATYEWSYETEAPTEKASNELLAKLELILKTAYRYEGAKAGIRPTVKDRKPLIGKHPKLNNVYIFNGLGTKGVSLAPYFSQHFVQHLIHDKPLLQEVDIKRFAYLYPCN